MSKGLKDPTYYASGQASPSTLHSKLKASQKKIDENDALDRLSDYKAALRKSVEDRGVDVSQPEF